MARSAEGPDSSGYPMPGGSRGDSGNWGSRLSVWVQIREHQPGGGRPPVDYGVTLLLLPSLRGWRGWPSAPRAQPQYPHCGGGAQDFLPGALVAARKAGFAGDRPAGKRGGAFSGSRCGVHVSLRCGGGSELLWVGCWCESWSAAGSRDSLGDGVGADRSRSADAGGIKVGAGAASVSSCW